MPMFYCVYCGEERSNVADLTTAACHCHPLEPGIGKHKLYEGDEKFFYTCQHCGKISRTIASLVSSPCHRHPNGTNLGSHEPDL